MPSVQLRFADEFSVSLAHIYSDKLLARIRNSLANLAEFPEIGSSNVRQNLIDHYGPNIRKIPVSNFVIVYRYEHDTVDVLALVYSPAIT